MNDEEYMLLALELAKKGKGKVNPNPLVGAVIVKDGRIIGQGYHERYGGLHAERNAFRSCTEPAEGAALYVTLEPCCHYGKTPPCTDAIIQNKIAKVVIGTLDPNPIMAGKSAEQLRNNGIDVVVGVLEEECQRLIRVFRKYITRQRPFVLMKYAMTMDGKIAARTGESKWITGEDARMHVQETRNEYRAIMVGVNTVIQDDPLLTCRLKDGRSPVRIICDTGLRTPLESQIVQTAKDVKTIIATSATDENKKELYRKKSCIVLDIPKKDGHIDLSELMRILGEQNIDSILLEGGGTLNWSALEAGIVDLVQTYIAPKIFGGTAKTPVNGLGVETPDDAYPLKNCSIERIGNDFLIESEVRYSCLQEL